MKNCNCFHKMELPKDPRKYMFPASYVCDDQVKWEEDPCATEKPIHIENHPDEEDLTEVSVNNELVLKFKDKMYDPEQFSGMGRVYLRKNLVPEDLSCTLKYRNILTQEMFEDSDGKPLVNTIFVILYDYDLNNKFISVPENCIFLFAGGSLSNGTLLLNDTLFLPQILEYNTHVNCNVKGQFKAGLVFYTCDALKMWDGECWMTIGLSDSKYLENLVKELDDKLTQALSDIQELLDNKITEERAKCLFVEKDVLGEYLKINEANSRFVTQIEATNTFATKEELAASEAGGISSNYGKACDLTIGTNNRSIIESTNGTYYNSGLLVINNEGITVPVYIDANGFLTIKILNI